MEPTKHYEQPNAAGISQPCPGSVCDLLLVERVLDGDAEALARLRTECDAYLRLTLLARGASETEADDLLADLWGDCVPGGDAGQNPLTRYNGRILARTWLAHAATNRFLDYKRRQTRQRQFLTGQLKQAPPTSEATGTRTSSLTEDTVVILLRESVDHAFRNCPADTQLMLRLFHGHQITQRQLARMWHWHPSKICRALEEGREQLESEIRKKIKETDPWLELSWEDVVELCGNC